jgi:DNA-binding transcriptional MerR regulator
MADSSKDKLFYKIGEVCERTGTQPYVLRFWESEFPMLKPRKNRSGQRIYQEADVRLVEEIKRLLYEEEYTIAGARRQLEQEGLRGTGKKQKARSKEGKRKKPQRAAAGTVPASEGAELDALREQVRTLTEERAARAREAHCAQVEADELRRRLEQLETAGLDGTPRDLLAQLREEARRLHEDLESLVRTLAPEKPPADGSS